MVHAAFSSFPFQKMKQLFSSAHCALDDKTHWEIKLDQNFELRFHSIMRRRQKSLQFFAFRWSCDHRLRGHGNEALKLNIFFTTWREDKNRLKKIIIGHRDVFSYLIFSWYRPMKAGIVAQFSFINWLLRFVHDHIQALLTSSRQDHVTLIHSHCQKCMQSIASIHKYSILYRRFDFCLRHNFIKENMPTRSSRAGNKFPVYNQSALWANPWITQWMMIVMSNFKLITTRFIYQPLYKSQRATTFSRYGTLTIVWTARNKSGHFFLR